MARVISWVVGLARLVILAVIAITVWPTATALVEGRLTWNQAVDSLFSDTVITWLIIALLLTLVISILRSTIARWAVAIAATATVVCFVTGTITLQSVSDSVDAYHLADKAKDTIAKCKLSVSVQEFGGQFRAVMKDPSADHVVGYLAEGANGVTSILDTQGKALPCATTS